MKNKIIIIGGDAKVLILKLFVKCGKRLIGI